MASSKVHPDLTALQGPPSNEPTGSPVDGPNTLPYPAATPAPGQPSLPTIPKPVPAPLSAQPAPFVPPPPSHNSVAPLPPPLYEQTYPPPASVGQYPIGYQQPYGYMQQQGQMTIIINGRPSPVYIRPNQFTTINEPMRALILSCLVFWCCGIIFGLVAFILAMLALRTANSKKKTHHLSVASYVVSGVGIGVAILVIIIVVPVVTRSTKTVCSTGYYETGGNCYQFRTSNTDSSSCSDFGGYFSDSYCYLDSATNYDILDRCGKGYYYISSTLMCYFYRSSTLTSGSCTNHGGYYDGSYCYYSNSCSLYTANGQCYRYVSIMSVSACISMDGYHDSTFCFYN